MCDAIEEIFRGRPTFSPETIACAPDEKGAYLLRIRLGEGAAIRVGSDIYMLSVGDYLYAGSAYGPGGIRARLRHHFRRDKKPHWHVDQLTNIGAEIDAWAFEGGQECALIAQLLDSGSFEDAVARFGASDCRTCPSHLLRHVSASPTSG
ncbi:MAG: GIY-YIG nuclease family protein [Sphingobium sp.]